MAIEISDVKQATWAELPNEGCVNVEYKSYLHRNGRVAICVDNENPPFDFVMLEGSVTLIDDLAEVKKWATIIGGRYMGAEQAEAFGERNGVEGELLVRIKIDKIVAKKNMSA